MNAKVLFILLGAIVILFAIVVVWGNWRGVPDEIEFPPAWAQSLAGRAAEPLDVDDLKLTTNTGCREQMRAGTFRLSPGVQCVLFVDEARAPTRTLTLAHQQGPQIEVHVDHVSDSRFDGSTELNSSAKRDTVDVYVFSEGGTITIPCPAGVTSLGCVIGVVR
jgi:hypothetical protein